MFGTVSIGGIGVDCEAKVQKMEIVGQEEDIMCQIVVRQVFVNESDYVKECFFKRATDEQMCCYAMRFVVNGKEINPVLMEKNEAKATYTEGVKKGFVSMYGENSGKGITTYRLGNLEAGKECIVEQKFAMTATLNKNGYHLKIPLKTAHQSGRVTSLLPSNFKFDFIIQSGFKIQGVDVEGIKYQSVKDEVGTFRVQSEEGSTIEEEVSAIHLNVKVNRDREGVGVQRGDYTAVGLLPNFKVSVESNSEFVFIVDCSASMGGNRINSAKNCLQLFIKSLPLGCRFSIILFGSTYDVIVPPCEYNDSTIERAMNVVSSIEADLGGTNLLSPLKWLLSKEPMEGFARQIFILTDGETGDSDECIAECARASSANRVFAVGIGGADPGLIEGMSKASHGVSAFVKLENDIKSKVIELLGSAISAAGVDTQVFVSGSETIETVPHPLPMLFNETPATIIMKGTKGSDDTILITANVEGSPLEIPIEITNKSPNDVPKKENEEKEMIPLPVDNLEEAIKALFAYESIKELEWRIKAGELHLKENVVKLSLSSGVLSRYTAYVGIDPIKPSLEKVLPSFDCFGLPPQYQSLGLRSLGVRSSEHQSPEYRSSEYQSLGVRSSEHQSPEYRSSEYQSLGVRSSEFRRCRTNADANSSLLNSKGLRDVSPYSKHFTGRKILPLAKGSLSGSNASDNSAIMKIINDQKADGSWPIKYATDSALVSKYGCAIAATILAIIKIKKMAKNDYFSYNLVIRKAFEFLRNKDKSTDWDNIILNLM